MRYQDMDRSNGVTKHPVVLASCLHTLDLEDTVCRIENETGEAIRRDGTLKWSYSLDENVDSTLTLDRDGDLVLVDPEEVYMCWIVFRVRLVGPSMKSPIFSAPVLCGRRGCSFGEGRCTIGERHTYLSMECIFNIYYNNYYEVS